MTVRLHIADKADAAELAELAAHLFKQTFGPVNTVEDMRDYLAANFTPAMQTAELAERARVVWMAEEDGVAVGFASLRREEDKNTAEVERIYVDRSLHGQNVGALLMTACVEQAKDWGCGSIWLAVWEENARAIAFYEKVGFVKTGEKKTFQLGSDTQHDYVMKRQLH